MREFWKFRDISRSYMLINGHRDRTFYQFPYSSMTFHVLPWVLPVRSTTFQSVPRPSNQFYDLFQHSLPSPTRPTSTSSNLRRWNTTYITARAGYKVVEKTGDNEWETQRTEAMHGQRKNLFPLVFDEVAHDSGYGRK